MGHVILQVMDAANATPPSESVEMDDLAPETEDDTSVGLEVSSYAFEPILAEMDGKNDVVPESKDDVSGGLEGSSNTTGNRHAEMDCT